jgi:hypothetical protein
VGEFILLFLVLYLPTLLIGEIKQRGMIECLINFKQSGRKRTCPNLRCYPGICLEELRKTTKNLSQDSKSSGRYLTPGPPKYEAVELFMLNS